MREAEVSRAWPDQIAIEVTERQAVVAVEREGTWRGVDEQGVAFRDFPAQPKGMPVVQMSATTSVEALAEAAAVVGALPPEIDRRVERLEVGSIDRIALLLKGGARVNWGSADQAEDKARVLAVLLDQKGPPATSYDVTAPRSTDRAVADFPATDFPTLLRVCGAPCPAAPRFFGNDRLT